MKHAVGRSLLAAWAFVTLALMACHEAGPDASEAPAQLGEDGLALACASDRTCPGGGECNPQTLRCELCSSDADCGDGRCDPDARVCVQCVDDGDCDLGHCHPTRNVCVGCWQDSQCDGVSVGPAGGGVCHPDRLVCVECLADRDCAEEGGRCNTQTSGCTGGCARDAQCDDNDPCTEDMCLEDGACAYTKRDDCGCGPAPECPSGSEPVDTNQDTCLDACACEGGEIIRPGGACPCAEPPICPIDTQPVDGDRDGCADACMCKNGALVGPDGSCPCPSIIACEGGLVASDLDGDGCPETCTKPCSDDCDCEAQGLVAAVPCPLACAQCGAFLVCDAGVCQGVCGVDDREACKCPEPPACGPLETAVDTDQDGCNDACRCLLSDPSSPEGCRCPFEITCTEGAHPEDSDQDGCADRCTCDEASFVPRPDGGCCPALVCDPGATPKDKDGDGCFDACVCADGTTTDAAAPRCPCLEDVDCKGGSIPTDTNEDRCADTCLCESGAAPGPTGCDVCLTTCEDQALPSHAVFVDVDQDGCYDLVDACPIGTFAEASPGAGCPDTCAPCDSVPVCPSNAEAVDGDGDNCPDTCVCVGGAPAPIEGCGCGNVVTCTSGEAAIDRDLDGCVDDCAVPCATRCDCAKAATDAGFAPPACTDGCPDCALASECVAGFCAYSCGAVRAGACGDAPGDATPVCGCDDVTYPSACEADVAGAAVKREGACESSGCTSDADCAAGELCETPSGVCPTATTPEGAAVPVSARGECQALPTACVGSDSPVCGCDGKTYENDCERRKAGVARAQDGVCP